MTEITPTQVAEARERLTTFAAAIRLPGHPFEHEGRAILVLLDLLEEAQMIAEPFAYASEHSGSSLHRVDFSRAANFLAKLKGANQ